jgi:hypothetical protein
VCHLTQKTGALLAIDPKYPLAGERDMVWIGDRYLTQVGALDQMAPGNFFVDAEAKRLYIGDDPAGQTVEVTAHKRALVLHTVDKGALATASAGVRDFTRTINVDADPSGTVIRGLGFARYADHGMILGAAGVRNLVRHNGGIGIFFEISRGAIIAFNVCHDNGAGVQLSPRQRRRPAVAGVLCER